MNTDVAVDRRIIALAVPALGSLAVEPLYVLVDTAIVGRLGTDQLAGLALAATVLSFVIAGSNFLTYGTTQRVAKMVGAGDSAGAANVGVQALWLSLLVGIPTTPLLIFGARQVTTVLGGNGDVLDHAAQYLSISAVGIPFVLVTLAAQGVLRGMSDYTTPLIILVAANVANLVIELVLVFGLDMGVAGSAWSTVISQIGAACAFALLIRVRLGAATIKRPDRDGLGPLVTAGRHLLLRVGSMLVVFGGATAVAARIDDVTLAAHQIVMSLFLFLALTLDALAVPAQTLVAEELGRNDVPRAAHIAERAVRLSVITAFIIGGLLAISSPVIPNAFTDDPAVAERATVGLVLLACMMLPGAIAFAHDGILIGAGDYQFLGRAAFGYLLAVIPIAVAVLLIPDLGLAGIWGGLLAWMIIRAVVNDRRTRHVLNATELSADAVRP